MTRMISTGLLAGAAALALATLPATAFAEGGPPTKNVVALPAATDPPDKHAVPADRHTQGLLLGDEGDPPGSLVGDEGEPPDTLTAAKLPGRPKAGEVTLASTETEPVDARKNGGIIVYGIAPTKIG